MHAPDDLPLDSQESYRPPQRDGGTGPAGVHSRTVRSVAPDALPGPSGESTGLPPIDSSDQAGEPPYRLIKPIGSGGYGEVWEATQAALNRTVAVKRLREDLHQSAESTVTSQEYDSSFRQEAFTTARLEHPNIVPIHDLGLDENGRPLLAMKLVRGRSWRELLDEDFAGMHTTEYLEKHLPILIDVAQAVAFAHSRGIAHRDLKPTQVMVGEYGEAMLMDWGLAVVFDGSLLEKSGHGAAGSFLSSIESASSPAGTPAFMAPEQTDSDARRIGPWTDVYLLGGCLFYLLSGKLPHGTGAPHWVFQLAKQGIIEHLDSAEMNAHPATPLVALARRATAPEINDRMQSAREFLDVLNDFMTGASRRRESLDLAAEAARQLDAAGSAPSYEVLTACLAKLDRARFLWAGNEQAISLRDRVIETYARAALRMGDLALSRAQAGTLPAGHAKEDVLARCERAEAISHAHRVQRRTLLVTTSVLTVALLGFAWKYSSDQRTARINLQQQADLAIDARGDAEELLNFMLGDLRDKVIPMGRSDVIEDVASEANEYLERLERRGGTLDDDDLLRKAITLRLIGFVHADVGEFEPGRSRMEEALDILEKQFEEQPYNAAVRAELAETHIGLSTIQLRAGQSSDALKEVETALDLVSAEGLGEELPATTRLQQLHCMALMSKATLLRVVGDREESLATAMSATECLGGMKGQGLDQPRFVKLIAQNHRIMADSLRDMGKFEEAEAEYLKSVEAAAAIAEANPLGFTYQAELAVYLDRLGDLYLNREQYDKARPVYERSFAIRERLSKVDPRSLSWKRDYLMSLDRFANVERLSGNAEDAREPTLMALAGRREIMAADPGNPRAWHEVANSLLQKGFLHSALEEDELVYEAYQESRSLLKQCVDADPNNVRWAEEYVEATNRVMLAFITMEDTERGTAYVDESQREVQRMVERFPSNPDILDEQVTCWYQAAMILRMSNRLTESIENLNTAMTMAAKMSASNDNQIRRMGEVWKGELEWHRAAVHAKAGEHADAWTWLEKALESGIEDYQMDNVRELAEKLKEFDEKAYGRVKGKLNTSVHE